MRLGRSPAFCPGCLQHGHCVSRVGRQKRDHVEGSHGEEVVQRQLWKIKSCFLSLPPFSPQRSIIPSALSGSVSPGGLPVASGQCLATPLQAGTQGGSPVGPRRPVSRLLCCEFGMLLGGREPAVAGGFCPECRCWAQGDLCSAASHRASGRIYPITPLTPSLCGHGVC